MKSIRDIRDEMGRRGSIVVLAAVFMIVILAFCSFTVDFGYIMLVDQEMQSAVDSAALAAAQELQIAPDGGQDRVVNAAVDLAAMNSVDGRNLTLLPSSDVEIGTWDELTGQFSPYTGSDLTQANAVRVSGELSNARQNAVSLFFAPIFGHDKHQISNQAIAVIGRTKMRDVMLVIDCSGSMSSYSRITMTRDAAQILIDELGIDDRLGLAVYSYPILIGDGGGIGNNNGAGLGGGFASAGGNQNGGGVRLSLTSLSDGMSARNGGGNNDGGNNGGGNNRRREWERQRNAAVGTA